MFPKSQTTQKEAKFFGPQGLQRKSSAGKCQNTECLGDGIIVDNEIRASEGKERTGPPPAPVVVNRCGQAWLGHKDG